MRMLSGGLSALWLAWLTLGPMTAGSAEPENVAAANRAGNQLLASNDSLVLDGDPASRMIAGIDRFLLHKIDEADASRDRFWDLDFQSEAAYLQSIEPRRERLREMLGLSDHRPAKVKAVARATPGESGVLASSPQVVVYAIRWPALHDPGPTGESLPSVWGEGLLLLPTGKILADVVAVPDADQTPESLCSLEPGVPETSRFPLRLAAAGCRVVVPFITSRQRESRNGRATLTDREYLHRSAFVLGRTLPGYEVQKILAAVDWLQSSGSGRPIGGIGYGEGGQLITFAAAVDQRFVTTGVSGFFASRSRMWQEPLDRNLFGFVSEFDSPQLGLLIAPRALIVEASSGPAVEIPGEGGAPGQIGPITPREAAAAFDRLRGAIQPFSETAFAESDRAVTAKLIIPQHPESEFGTPDFLTAFLQSLTAAERSGDGRNWVDRAWSNPPLQSLESEQQRLDRQHRRRQQQLAEIDRHNQRLWRVSGTTREAYFADLNRSNVKAFTETVEIYRERFRKDVIGEFDDPLLAPRPRLRETWKGEGWTGYEVMLDVFPNVFAYGALLLPDDLKPDDRRPVVVCQHGLEGRPTDTFLDDHRAYHDYASRLCQQGYVVFAPQNPYIFGDRFRTLQRKAQPLGRSLFSVIVPQHQQIVNWLKSLPFVDDDRIAFYGLSYGGKSAMRIPALVTDYALSICSADFNEWVLKNVSTQDRFSYVWTGEYEIFEWNLGSTFNYAEMAALICPRPFMVERGHFDGVATDEWVAHEYAKVRHLYAARLGIPERTEIEWFVGPHAIQAEGTFAFLQRHLQWTPSVLRPHKPKPQQAGAAQNDDQGNDRDQ